MRAWVTDASGQTPDQPLGASTGSLTGRDVATWSFANAAVDPGGVTEARAKVVVQHKALGQQECDPHVYLAQARAPSPSRGSDHAGVLSGRTLLLPTDNEPSGYGFYSYLLLVWDWMRAFCALAAQEQSWNRVALTKFGLNTRNVIAVGNA